jgi:hypothetical protein
MDITLGREVKKGESDIEENCKGNNIMEICFLHQRIQGRGHKAGGAHLQRKQTRSV